MKINLKKFALYLQNNYNGDTIKAHSTNVLFFTDNQEILCPNIQFGAESAWQTKLTQTQQLEELLSKMTSIENIENIEIINHRFTEKDDLFPISLY